MLTTSPHGSYILFIEATASNIPLDIIIITHHVLFVNTFFESFFIFLSPLGRFQATPILQFMDALESLLPTPFLNIILLHPSVECNRQIAQNFGKKFVQFAQKKVLDKSASGMV